MLFLRKIFFKELRRINEAKKCGWKHYCSLKCQLKNKTKRKTFLCRNPLCKKTFQRQIHRIPLSGDPFCSSSCAAIVNNQKRKKPLKIKECPTCGTKFTDRRKYCTRSCQSRPLKVPKKSVINQIKKFYEKNKRIPFKKEVSYYKAARLRFGTWNKAIKTAGFEPNPVKFAKKFIANDGHKCDSLAEKIIDDWLYARKIKHQINVPYPGNHGLTVDFFVKNIWIEFFGLSGELKSYDKLKKKKIGLAKENKMSLIKIYPEHLFPINKLNKVLEVILS